MPTDDSLSLLTRGYGFGARIWRRRHAGARSAPMRLLGDETMLVRGADGVELFYDDQNVARHGAMPALVQETLFGHGSVHSLDGAEHRHRKATFVDVAYEDEQVERFTPLLEREWGAELDAWLAGGHRSAYDAAVGAFGRASMRWAGLPGTPDAKTRCRHDARERPSRRPCAPARSTASRAPRCTSGRGTAIRRASCCRRDWPAPSCRTASGR
mgnify:CR=1 FL=1